jgi:hypothetical protein
MNTQNQYYQIEEKIIDKVKIWIKEKKPELKEIESKILEEIKNNNYLAEDWQVEYAKQRITEKICENIDERKENQKERTNYRWIIVFGLMFLFVVMTLIAGLTVAFIINWILISIWLIYETM